MRSFLICLAAALAASLVAACGDDSGGGPDAGGSEIDVVYDETYDPSACALTSCSGGKILTACTCVDPPRTEEVFATNRVGCSELVTEGPARTFEEDYCDEAGAGGPPDLGCFMPGMYRPLGTPMTGGVTLFGVVDVFGNGGDADAILVQVFAEGEDGALGAMVGEATASIADPCHTTEQELRDGMPIGERALGYYAIPGVPTETPLIVKTSGNPDFWRDLYTYNFQIVNEGVLTSPPAAEECISTPPGARFRYKARTLSRSDYSSIPRTAGLPDGVRAGSGAVAGEVHDCQNVRLEYALVATSPTPRSFVYFNDNPDNPLPEPGRIEGTSMLSLYAALDLEPGPVDVAAVGSVGGQVVSLGWYRATVFENSVTVVALRGLRPQQTGE